MAFEHASPLSGLLLPPRTRLVHIGAPKTGTTALQHAASSLRPALRSHGVEYPGSGLNHQQATSVLIGRAADAWDGQLPPEEWWHRAKTELEAASGRTLLSFELICQADLPGVERVYSEIGPDLHAVLVLRNFGTLLPSMWQQTVKMGSTKSLEDFLRAALADPTEVSIPGSDAFHRSDGLNLIERWCSVVGPQRITVIVLEPDQPDRLFDAFEGMLGLPSGLLASAPDDGYQANRGMSTVEVELFRALNMTVLSQWRVDKLYHRQLVWMGAIDRVLAMRDRPSAEQGVRLLEWASGPAQAAGSFLADAVRRSGVRVVGDIDALVRPVRTMDPDELQLPTTIPVDLALEALRGMFARAVGTTAFQTGAVPSPPQRPLRHPKERNASGETVPFTDHDRDNGGVTSAPRRRVESLKSRARGQLQRLRRRGRSTSDAGIS